jgi:hypothetical protein
MKTLVVAKHEHGPATNGHDGCHARFNNDGICPGVAVAAWLNSLGDDEAPYKRTGRTCGEVRDNWLSGSNHIVAAEPEQAALAATVRDLRAKLAVARRRLTQVSAEVRQ